MDRDIENIIQNCEACAATRPLNLNTPLQPVSFPAGPWLKGAVDIVGTIDNKYLVTFTDNFSSFPEVEITKDISSKNIVRILSNMFAIGTAIQKRLSVTMGHNLSKMNSSVF